MKNLWTNAQVAEYLQVSEQTLANWRWRGFGPQFVKLGSVVRYRPEEVEKWVDKQAINGHGEA